MGKLIHLGTFYNDLEYNENFCTFLSDIFEIANMKGIEGHRLHSLHVVERMEGGSPELKIYEFNCMVEENEDI